MLIKTVCRGLLDAVYPPICLLCGRFSDGPFPHCCADCLDSFEPVGSSCCTLCGEPFSPVQDLHLCLKCIRGRMPFKWCRGLYLYRDGIADALALFKYRNQLQLLGPLEQALVMGVENLKSFPEADLLVPVPLSRGGLWKRGFNQSYLLGSKLTRRLGLPVFPDILTRKGNLKQVGLPAGKRALSAMRSFMPGRKIGKVRGRRVLLFDDVYTTGATVRACARILKQGGAKEVYVLTLARAKGRS